MAASDLLFLVLLLHRKGKMDFWGAKFKSFAKNAPCPLGVVTDGISIANVASTSKMYTSRYSRIVVDKKLRSTHYELLWSQHLEFHAKYWIFAFVSARGGKGNVPISSLYFQIHQGGPAPQIEFWHVLWPFVLIKNSLALNTTIILEFLSTQLVSRCLYCFKTVLMTLK